MDKPRYRRTPPEPPDILDVFENQRYISKLFQWSLERSGKMSPEGPQVCRCRLRHRQESNEIERQACYPSEFRFGFLFQGCAVNRESGNLGPDLLKRFRVFHHG